MNLVDAIRAAAQKSKEPVETPLMPESDYHVEQDVQKDAPPGVTCPVKKAQGSSNVPIAPKDGVDGMHTVRFEVLITQHQVSDLLQWLAHNMCSVMTLREAAHYLRLRTTQVQALAEHGDLPAFRVDGKWRFLKTMLDEWMSLQQTSNFETVPPSQEGKQVA